MNIFFCIETLVSESTTQDVIWLMFTEYRSPVDPLPVLRGMHFGSTTSTQVHRTCVSCYRHNLNYQMKRFCLNPIFFADINLKILLAIIDKQVCMGCEYES